MRPNLNHLLYLVAEYSVIVIRVVECIAFELKKRSQGGRIPFITVVWLIVLEFPFAFYIVS